MAKKRLTTKELGIYKNEISTALYKNENIREILLGDTSKMAPREMMEEFKKHVKSHLFIDETITDADSFIYYDIIVPSLQSNIKQCKVIIYAICHRDIIDDSYIKDGYYGNRADIIEQMIEESLLDEDVVNNFGIGELKLDSIGIYNSTRFYGRIMEYVVPNFR